mmetsp:Transcript_28077/g.83647  ORF Transcript_28077/g.83647 Transcript_28077/m.83647 type:complete len:96 (-) Transcript_28077:399-686(-)
MAEWEACTGIEAVTGLHAIACECIDSAEANEAIPPGLVTSVSRSVSSSPHSCRGHTPSGRPEPRGLDLSLSLVHATAGVRRQFAGRHSRAGVSAS